MTTRYQVVELARKKNGFAAVIVDNKHPAGVSGVPVKWFVTTADAVKELKAAGASYEVIKQPAKA